MKCDAMIGSAGELKKPEQAQTITVNWMNDITDTPIGFYFLAKKLQYFTRDCPCERSEVLFENRMLVKFISNLNKII